MPLPEPGTAEARSHCWIEVCGLSLSPATPMAAAHQTPEWLRIRAVWPGFGP